MALNDNPKYRSYDSISKVFFVSLLSINTHGVGQFPYLVVQLSKHFSTDSSPAVLSS